MSTESFNPYVGLRPFEADENLLFFGRDVQTLELLQRLHEHRFVAVVGGSGSGKSSLIRAGLIPALKGGFLIEDSRTWVVYTMKPGQSAMFNLARTLLSEINPEVTPSEIKAFVTKIKREGTRAITQALVTLKEKGTTNFFLLVDQFEELFRLSSESNDGAKKTDAIDFVNTILALSKQSDLSFYVVLTMRSDFIGDCAEFRDLPEAMNKSQYLVPRLTRQQLKTVIEGPSKLYGKKFDPTLTSRLINDLEKVKDELPLVQHALMRMWNHEVQVDQNGVIDFQDYQAVGGIENALSNHAEEALMGMDASEKNIAKELFQALTAVDENGRKIRRPLLFSDLQSLTGASKEQLNHIIDQFIKDQRSFLIVQTTSNGDDKVIDISHESLIRQWGTLHKWVEEEAESASFYLQLAEAYRLYDANKKDYLTGSELQLAMDWRDTFKPSAVWANRYKSGFEESMVYLEESNREHIRLQNLEKSRRKKQKILVFTIMALIGLFAVYALVEGENAKSREAIATNKKNAFELHFHATVVESKDPTTALRLEEEALKLYEYPAFRKLAMELVNNHPLYQFIVKDSVTVVVTEISPSGKFILIGTDKGQIRLWNNKGALLHSYQAHKASISALEFTLDETGFVSGATDASIGIWSVRDTTIIKSMQSPSPILKITQTKDGDIVTGDAKGTISFWNGGGTIERSFSAHNDLVSAIAFSPDGERLVTGSRDKTAKLWDLSGKLIQEFKNHKGEVYDVAFSPDGTSVLTGSWDSKAKLWKLGENSDPIEFKGHWGAILSVAFSPDGQQILTGSFDNTMRLWDLEGNLLDDFKGHQGEIRSVSFIEDGKTILSASRDGTARIWFRGHTIKTRIEQNQAIRSVRFDPEGGTTFLNGTQGKAQIWNFNGELQHEFSCAGSGMVYSAVYSPDGATIVTSSGDGTVQMWKKDGTSLWKKKYVENSDRPAVRAIAFAPDGKSFATVSWDAMIRLWNLDGTIKKEYKHTQGFTSVAFSPKGLSIVAGSFGKSLLWYFKTGEVVIIDEPSQLLVNAVAFTPDGENILTGSYDYGARLWSLNGTLIQEFKGPRGGIRSVMVSNNGKYIATGSDGGTARLWDMEANILAEYQYDRGSVFTVTFSKDDQYLLMGSGDTMYRLQIIELDRFLEDTPLEPLSEEKKKKFNLVD